jgi:hypothetical protein
LRLQSKRGQLIRLSKHSIKKIRQLIYVDSLFLRSQNLMDYSLLLVVENNNHVFSPNSFVSIDGREVYHLGIIDYL